MASLNGIIPGLQKISDNIALVTPQLNVGYQPISGQGVEGTSELPNPPAFLFDYEGENGVHLQSEITDHYIEDLTAIQDHWALRPPKVTVHGFIGELTDLLPIPVLGPLVQTVSKLLIIDDFSPAFSASALIALNDAASLYTTAKTTVDTAVSAFDALANGGQPSQTKQQVAFQKLYGYWNQRLLWTIQTPWMIFKNMALEEVRPIQEPETKMVTDYFLTFKAIRTATVISGATPAIQGRAAQQSKGLTDLGTSTPVNSIPLSQGLAGVTP